MSATSRPHLGAGHPKYEPFLYETDALHSVHLDAWYRIRCKAHGPWNDSAPRPVLKTKVAVNEDTKRAARVLRRMSDEEVWPEGRAWWNEVASLLDGQGASTDRRLLLPLNFNATDIPGSRGT